MALAIKQENRRSLRHMAFAGYPRQITTNSTILELCAGVAVDIKKNNEWKDTADAA